MNTLHIYCLFYLLNSLGKFYNKVTFLNFQLFSGRHEFCCKTQTIILYVWVGGGLGRIFHIAINLFRKTKKNVDTCGRWA